MDRHATLLAAAGLYVWLIFLPTQRDIELLNDALAEQQRLVLDEELIHAQITSTSAELEQVRSLHRNWLAAAPPRGQLYSLFERINTPASQFGLTTLRFDPLEVVDHQALRQVPVSLSVSGTYFEIMWLMRAIELMPETIWLENIELKAANELGQDMRCDVQLVIFTTAEHVSRDGVGKFGETGQGGRWLPIFRRIMIRAILASSR